jgi:hypothetical protein
MPIVRGQGENRTFLNYFCDTRHTDKLDKSDIREGIRGIHKPSRIG